MWAAPKRRTRVDRREVPEATPGEPRGSQHPRAVPEGWVKEFQTTGGEPRRPPCSRCRACQRADCRLLPRGETGSLRRRPRTLRISRDLERCGQKRLGRYLYNGRPELRLEDVDEIAQGTVVGALGSFRDRVLIRGKWNPAKGARPLRILFLSQRPQPPPGLAGRGHRRHSLPRRVVELPDRLLTSKICVRKAVLQQAPSSTW